MPQAPTDPGSTSTKVQQSVSFALSLAILLAVYSLTFNGILRIDDEHILMARSQSLALWGDFAEPQVYGNARQQGLLELDEAAVQIEPLQALISAPIYRLAVELGLGGSQASLVLPIFLTIMTAAVIGLIVRVLGFASRTVIWCILLFGLGTMAWPYAMTFFRDVLTMFMSSLVFLGWALWNMHHSRWKPLAAGLIVVGILGAISSKNTGVLLLASLVLAFGYTLFLSKNSGKSAWLPYGLGLFLLVVFAVWTQVELTGALARFDSSYYLFLAEFFIRNIDPNTLLAFFGPFLSPTRSIFIFSPVLLLCIPSIPLWRNRAWFAIPTIAYGLLIVIAQAFFYGLEWAGILNWGLRFMLPVLPALVVLSAPLIEILLGEEKKWYRAVLPSLLVVGILVQIAGSVVDWREFNRFLSANNLGNGLQVLNWNPYYLAIPFHLQSLLQPSRWAISIVHNFHQQPWLSFITLFLGVVVMGFSSWIVLSRREKTSAQFKYFLLIGAFALPFLVLLSIRSDPRWGGGNPAFPDSLNYLQSNLKPGEAVVFDSYGSELWLYGMNHWSSVQEWYALPYKVPTTNAVAAEGVEIGQPSRKLFETLGMDSDYLWYLSSSDTPSDLVALDVNVLMEQFDLVSQQIFQGDPQVTIYQFRSSES
jgi:hypothetical protein